MSGGEVTVPTTLSVGIMRKVVLDGDLLSLNDSEQLTYYKARCEAAGLDPRSKPFGYFKDKRSGKLSLYAEKAAGEQLARLHAIGVVIDYHKREGGDLPIYMVKVRGMSMADKRTSEEIGCVPLFRQEFVEDPEGDADGKVWAWNADAGRRTARECRGRWETRQFIGEDLCNAMMKAVTKAKRRLILSMVGLGMVDETELDTMDVERVATPEAAEELEHPGDRMAVDAWKQKFAGCASEDELREALAEMEGATLRLPDALQAEVSDAFAERLGGLLGGER